MLKNLVKIANRLDELGLTKDADLLDSIIRKLAAPPLEDIVPMNKWEPINSNYQINPRGKGPLSYYRGNVVLNDV